ncbi:P-loop containing nucleoside triphosphate hydrolase [Cenococcum geophilum]
MYIGLYSQISTTPNSLTTRPTVTPLSSSDLLPNHNAIILPLTLAYKEVDKYYRWDKKAYKYKIAELVTLMGELSKLEQYGLFSTYKSVDRLTKEPTYYINIKSELLRDILRDMPLIKQNVLYYFLPNIKSKDAGNLKHLGLLINYINNIYKCLKYTYSEEIVELNSSIYFRIKDRTRNDLIYRIIINTIGFYKCNPKYPRRRVNKKKPDTLDFALEQLDNDKLVLFNPTGPNNSFDNFIEGKGRRLVFLLHGPPGIRKTLIAKAITESYKTPLYIIAARKLGTESTKVEGLLSIVFKVVSYVFLAQRIVNNTPNNSLVLTFNKAVISRIYYGIRYGPLGSNTGREIYTKKGNAEYNLNNFRDLAKYKLNGQEIKNTVLIARALAGYYNTYISLQPLTVAINTIKEFRTDFTARLGIYA